LKGDGKKYLQENKIHGKNTGKIQSALAHLLTVLMVSCSRCFQINDPVNHQFMLIAQTVTGTLSNDPN